MKIPAPLWEVDPERRESGRSLYWRPWWAAAASFGARLVVIDPASVACAGVSPSDGAAVRAFLLAVTQEAEAMGTGRGRQVPLRCLETPVTGFLEKKMIRARDAPYL